MAESVQRLDVDQFLKQQKIQQEAQRNAQKAEQQKNLEIFRFTGVNPGNFNTDFSSINGWAGNITGTTQVALAPLTIGTNLVGGLLGGILSALSPIFGLFGGLTGAPNGNKQQAAQTTQPQQSQQPQQTSASQSTDTPTGRTRGAKTGASASGENAKMRAMRYTGYINGKREKLNTKGYEKASICVGAAVEEYNEAMADLGSKQNVQDYYKQKREALLRDIEGQEALLEKADDPDIKRDINEAKAFLESQLQKLEAAANKKGATVQSIARELAEAAKKTAENNKDNSITKDTLADRMAFVRSSNGVLDEAEKNANVVVADTRQGANGTPAPAPAAKPAAGTPAKTGAPAPAKQNVKIEAPATPDDDSLTEIPYGDHEYYMQMKEEEFANLQSEFGELCGKLTQENIDNLTNEEIDRIENLAEQYGFELSNDQRNVLQGRKTALHRAEVTKELEGSLTHSKVLTYSAEDIQKIREKAKEAGVTLTPLQEAYLEQREARLAISALSRKYVMSDPSNPNKKCISLEEFSKKPKIKDLQKKVDDASEKIRTELAKVEASKKDAQVKQENEKRRVELNREIEAYNKNVIKKLSTLRTERINLQNELNALCAAEKELGDITEDMKRRKQGIERRLTQIENEAKKLRESTIDSLSQGADKGALDKAERNLHAKIAKKQAEGRRDSDSRSDDSVAVQLYKMKENFGIPV